MDVLFLVLGEWLGCVRGLGVLNCGAVSGFGVFVRLMLWFCQRIVSKSDEGFLDVSRHAQVDTSVLEIPVEG